MAVVVEYTGEQAYGPAGSYARPMVAARITDPIGERAIERLVLVDSGADLSAIPMGGLLSLGLDPATLPRVSSRGTAGEVSSLEVELLFEVCGARAMSRVLVPMTPEFSTYILGREPFFRLLHFGFQQFPEPSENRVLWRTGVAPR